MYLVECTVVQWGTSVSGGMVTHKGLSCLLHSLIKQSHHWTITMTLIYQWHHHDHHITVSSEKDFQEGRDTNQMISRGWPAEFEANSLAQHRWEGDIFKPVYASMHQCIIPIWKLKCSSTLLFFVVFWYETGFNQGNILTEMMLSSSYFVPTVTSYRNQCVSPLIGNR